MISMEIMMKLDEDLIVSNLVALDVLPYVEDATSLRVEIEIVAAMVESRYPYTIFLGVGKKRKFVDSFEGKGKKTYVRYEDAIVTTKAIFVVLLILEPLKTFGMI
ncbi:hypothetical protein V6N11_074206 [Hibiscus sabdariffa]|uniref:Uncharacterized protein n=1 Tax=Hibiscus sabdariffa TaxID=183260 RepID=A0ABR2NJH2_9ROSI